MKEQKDELVPRELRVRELFTTNDADPLNCAPDTPSYYYDIGLLPIRAYCLAYDTASVRGLQHDRGLQWASTMSKPALLLSTRTCLLGRNRVL